MFSFNTILLAASSQTSGAGGIGTWGMIIWIVLLIALMYFLMIRPQKKQQKKEKEMRESIQIGDDIITISGLYARIVAIKDDSFIVETGPDRTKLRIARSAVSQNLTVHE